MDTATASPPIRDHLRPLRYLWRVPLLLVHAVLAIMLAAFVMSWNRNRVMQDGREPFPHKLVRWWSTALMRIFGLRAVRVGEPLADPLEQPEPVRLAQRVPPPCLGDEQHDAVDLAGRVAQRYGHFPDEQQAAVAAVPGE